MQKSSSFVCGNLPSTTPTAQGDLKTTITTNIQDQPNNNIPRLACGIAAVLFCVLLTFLTHGQGMIFLWATIFSATSTTSPTFPVSSTSYGKVGFCKKEMGILRENYLIGWVVHKYKKNSDIPLHLKIINRLCITPKVLKKVLLNISNQKGKGSNFKIALKNTIFL